MYYTTAHHHLQSEYLYSVFSVQRAYTVSFIFDSHVRLARQTPSHAQPYLCNLGTYFALYKLIT